MTAQKSQSTLIAIARTSEARLAGIVPSVLASICKETAAWNEQEALYLASHVDYVWPAQGYWRHLVKRIPPKGRKDIPKENAHRRFYQELYAIPEAGATYAQLLAGIWCRLAGKNISKGFASFLADCVAIDAKLGPTLKKTLKQLVLGKKLQGKTLDLGAGVKIDVFCQGSISKQS